MESEIRSASIAAITKFHPHVSIANVAYSRHLSLRVGQDLEAREETAEDAQVPVIVPKTTSDSRGLALRVPLRTDWDRQLTIIRAEIQSSTITA
jgi:hypothetical protein